jgi:hypothetical protein
VGCTEVSGSDARRAAMPEGCFDEKARNGASLRLGFDVPHGVCLSHATVLAQIFAARLGRTLRVSWEFQQSKRCAATTKSTGLPCRRPAMHGTPVCRVHGSLSVQHGHKARRKVRTPDGRIVLAAAVCDQTNAMAAGVFVVRRRSLSPGRLGRRVNAATNIVPHRAARATQDGRGRVWCPAACASPRQH